MVSPNFLLLTIDTLRTDMLGCYGSSRGLTPNLDRFAKDAVFFHQAVTGGSWTQAAFPPMLTSTYASEYGGCLGPLSTERPSPIEALMKAGYHTRGYSTSPLLSKNYGYDRGFVSWHDLIPEERDPMLRGIKGGEKLLRMPFTHSIARTLGIQSRPARKYCSIVDLNEQLITDLVDPVAPFFIWAHIMDTHWPYHIDEALIEPHEIAQAWQDLSAMYGVNRKGRELTPELEARFLNLYEEALRFTDAVSGRLLENLQEIGALENTIVIILSDHGEEFMERKNWGHFEVNLYDEIIRVPLMIRMPDKGPGHEIDQQVRLLDLMPTILDLAGCPAPRGMEGDSFAGLISGDDASYNYEFAISEMWRPEQHIVAIRSVEYKFIWDSTKPDSPQLYHLLQDPLELSDIAGQEQSLIDRFRNMLDDHLNGREDEKAEDLKVHIENDPDVLRRLRDLGYVD